MAVAVQLQQSSADVTSPLSQPPNDAAFHFVRALAGELSSGRIELPSFPEVAVRVRRILSDPESSIDQVVRVVGSEPSLAARLLRIANSASLNRSGRSVTDLRTAINRIGYNMVRSASISFAMSQIRKSGKLVGLEQPLNELWQRSTLVAAFAYVLARTCSRINPDEAMLTGMMHGIGKLYVLTRAIDHPELFANKNMLDDIVKEWHASIGKAILENWDFPEATAVAVGEQDELERDDTGAGDLRDIIAVAILMATYQTDRAALDRMLLDLPAGIRLGLDEAKTEVVMTECAAEVIALSQALGE
jgi:HD-like signal output (HDOD) protein